MPTIANAHLQMRDLVDWRREGAAILPNAYRSPHAAAMYPQKAVMDWREKKAEASVVLVSSVAVTKSGWKS